MNTLLVVEDEAITSDMLRRFFEIVGYEVLNAQTGYEAIKMAVEHQPKVIILDIMLPDIDGYEVCKKLRNDSRTDSIPIIFLTRKDERSARINGLELGADDYITKPFDVEELRLRVHNIIDRAGGTALVDSRTSLPSVTLIKERLPKLVEDPNSVFIDAKIEHFESFSQQYGPVAANQVIRGTARIIGDLLHEIDPTKTFIGHPHDQHFLIAVPKDAADRVENELPTRFKEQVEKYYDYPDQQRGKMKMDDDSLVEFMSVRLMRVKAEMLKVFLDRQGVQPAATPEEETKAEPPEKEKKAEKSTSTPIPKGVMDAAKATVEKAEEEKTAKPAATQPADSAPTGSTRQKSAAPSPDNAPEAERPSTQKDEPPTTQSNSKIISITDAMEKKRASEQDSAPSPEEDTQNGESS